MEFFACVSKASTAISKCAKEDAAGKGRVAHEQKEYKRDTCKGIPLPLFWASRNTGMIQSGLADESCLGSSPKWKRRAKDNCGQVHGIDSLVRPETAPSGPRYLNLEESLGLPRPQNPCLDSTLVHLLLK